MNCLFYREDSACFIDGSLLHTCNCSNCFHPIVHTCNVVVYLFQWNACNWFFPSFVSYMIDNMIISKMDMLIMPLPRCTGTGHHIESPYRHAKEGVKTADLKLGIGGFNTSPRPGKRVFMFFLVVEVKRLEAEVVEINGL